MNHDTFQIAPDVGGTDPQRFDPLGSQPGIASPIALRIVSEFMANPIDFDCQTCSFAEEVENERAEGMLPAEWRPFGRSFRTLQSLISEGLMRLRSWRA